MLKGMAQDRKNSRLRDFPELTWLSRDFCQEKILLCENVDV